jgi:hypothetical protein
MHGCDSYDTDWFGNRRLAVYDFATNQWHNARNAPTGVRGETCCNVVFHGIIYILMDTQELWSYDIVNDAWNDTGLIIDPAFENPRLLVSDNRLFLGSWVQERLSVQDRSKDGPWIIWKYELHEVVLEERRLNRLFQMRNGVIQECFGGAQVTESIPMYRIVPFDANAFGLYRSIVLVNATSEICRVYDLRKHSRNALPRLPGDCHYVCGNSMNLILPASVFWKHETELVEAVRDIETSGLLG